MRDTENTGQQKAAHGSELDSSLWRTFLKCQASVRVTDGDGNRWFPDSEGCIWVR